MIGDELGWLFPPSADCPPHVNRLRDLRNYLHLAFRELGFGLPTARQYEAAHWLQHGPPLLMVQGFRGMGKSLVCCIAIPWVHLWWRDKRAIVLSAADPRALANAQLIRRAYEEVSVVRHLAPPPEKLHRDSAHAFDVNGASPATDTSVRALGITGQITGFHGDLLVPDDIEVPKTSESPSARMKLRAQTTEFGPILNPGGRIWVLGTPQCEDTLYRAFPERGYTIRKWPSEYPDRARLQSYGAELAPSIRAELEADPDLEGEPTEPVRHGRAVLDHARRQFLLAGYTLQYLLDTTLTDSERFPLRLRDLIVMDVNTELAPEQVVWGSGPEQMIADIPCLGRDGDVFCRPIKTVGEWLPYTGSVIAVDPAGRGRDELSWTVVKILNGQLFVPDWGAELDGFEGLPRVAEAAARHQVNTLLTESNFGGGAFTKLLQDALRDVHPCKVEEITHTTRKERRILRTLEPIMMAHKLVVSADALRKDYELAQKRGGDTWIYYSLAYQLTRLADQPQCLPHDDRVDSLAIGVDYFATRVEANTERFLERRRKDAEDQEWARFCRSVGQKPGRTEPNCLNQNRARGFLRGGGMPRRKPKPRIG